MIVDRTSSTPGLGSCIVYRADLLISLIRIKDHYLLVTRAASATTLPGSNCQDGGVREIRIGPAVGRAARCDGLTLLVAGEPTTIARAGIVVCLAGNTDTRLAATGVRQLRKWAQTS
jgi:hypothetical protein